MLRGHNLSVCNQTARVTLHEKCVLSEREEVDSFAPDIPEDCIQRHPSGRVPVLNHGEFDLCETTAIARNADVAFDGPSLMPTEAEPLARVAHVISIVDSDARGPMVRQVFSHRAFRPTVGEEYDETGIASGIEAAIPNFEIHEQHTYSTLPGNRNVCVQDVRPENGRIAVPDGPGHRIDLNEAFLHRQSTVMALP